MYSRSHVPCHVCPDVPCSNYILIDLYVAARRREQPASGASACLGRGCHRPAEKDHGPPGMLQQLAAQHKTKELVLPDYVDPAALKEARTKFESAALQVCPRRAAFRAAFRPRRGLTPLGGWGCRTGPSPAVRRAWRATRTSTARLSSTAWRSAAITHQPAAHDALLIGPWSSSTGA